MREIDLNAERAFENSKVLDSDVRKAQSKYYWATDLPFQAHMANVLETIEGKRVLELGCSNGRDAKLYTTRSGSFVGVDIADEAINQANDLGLRNAEFLCTDGHKLPFDGQEFDFVIVNGLLHHLDLEVAFSEISRVLKPSGELIFKEPLGTNPVFQLYRWLTPSARTVDERPFTFADLKLMGKYFELRDVTWYGFLSIFSAFGKVDSLRKLLTAIDRAFATTPVRYFFWQFCGFAAKR